MNKYSIHWHDRQYRIGWVDIAAAGVKLAVFAFGAFWLIMALL